MIKKRIFLIGIDGGSWNLINEGIQNNGLSNFKKIIDFGVKGDLKTPIPPLSPSSWNSIYTGLKPNKHRIYGFTKFDNNRKFFSYISSKDRKSPPFWSILSGKYRLILFNLPFTYPVERVNGLITSGIGVPSINSNFTYPENFKNFLLKNYPDYNIDYNEISYLSKEMNGETKISFLRNIEKILEKEIEISKYLIKNETFDIFFTVFRALDVVQHFFWDNKKIIMKFYKKIDEVLGYVLRNLNENDCIFIISDHGFDEVNKYVYINNILEQKALLVIEKSSLNKVFLNNINAEIFKNILIKLKLRGLVKSVRNNILCGYILRVIPSKELDYFVNINWLQTKAFFLRGSDGLIYINSNIKKNSEDYNSICGSIISSLVTLRDEENNQVFSSVLRYNDLYGGMPQENAPDIILSLHRGYRAVDYNSDGKIFGPPIDKTHNERKGDHTMQGIFLAYGSQIKKLENINLDINVWDVIPTILYILDEKILYADGRVVKEIFEENLEHPKYAKMKQERLRIKDRIRNLNLNKE